jgi:hypothetical protein
VALDADRQRVTARNVLPGHGPAARDAVTRLAQEEQAHGNDVPAVSRDGAGVPGAARRALTAPGGPPVAVYVPPKAVPPTAFVTPEQFTLDATGETLTGPNGPTTATKRRRYRDGGGSFRCARAACAAGPPHRQCVPRRPPTTGRVVLKNPPEAAYRAARSRAPTAAYPAVRREQPARARQLGERVRWHRGRRARSRGPARVRRPGLRTGLVVNGKRLVSRAGAAAGGGGVGAGWAGAG